MDNSFLSGDGDFNPGAADDPFSALLNLDSFSDLWSPPLLSPTPPRSPSTADDAEASDIIPAVPRSLAPTSLSEKMLKALSLIKVSPDYGGFLVQVWRPVKQGDDYVLSTSEQPYLLDQMMSGYREVSRAFTFAPREAPGAFPGLPGRVFMSGVPEWTSNVGYYNRFEYLRVEHAVRYEVRGSLAVPIFNSPGRKCCGVLELVTMSEKADFDAEMDDVCSALQAVGLQTTDLRTQQQNLTTNQIPALTEILDVLRAVCHAHMLPLALTWIPYDGATLEEIRDANHATPSAKEKSTLCVQASASYVNDIRMQGFLHACSEHSLEKGQGPAGKALQSHQAFFAADVKSYDICEYPLAHHARKYGLQAAVAIRLRSTYTGDNDYVLELFLPVNCRGAAEQQLLLDSLSRTMQKMCRSLRRVLDDGVVAEAAKVKVDIPRAELTSSPSTDIPSQQSQGIGHSQRTVRVTEIPFEAQHVGTKDQSEDPPPQQLKSKLPRNLEKKRSTLEKNISLSVLQQYFSGSLKDAAKSIGVCPTTLKRICRQHGVSRWPSRKIKKVNRSLKKIQSVINSVEGVEGSLKYDPTTGCLVASVSSSDKPSKTTSDTLGLDLMPMSSSRHRESKQLVGKLEIDDCSVDRNQGDTSGRLRNPDTQKYETYKAQPPYDLCLESFDSQFTPRSSISMAAVDEICANIGVNNVLAEHSYPSSSSMTDSSSSSPLSCPSFEKRSESRGCMVEGGLTITVKATYKEDTVRFKLLRSLGFNQLFEEIGKRLELQTGTFQVKYMDDEDEWVMLACDSDWHECIDVLQSMGSHTIKLLVRDGCGAIGARTGI